MVRLEQAHTQRLLAAQTLHLALSLQLVVAVPVVKAQTALLEGRAAAVDTRMQAALRERQVKVTLGRMEVEIEAEVAVVLGRQALREAQPETVGTVFNHQ